MTKPDYTPTPNSFASLVIGFFTNNPNAELSVDDLYEKFKPTGTGSIHVKLADALAAGYLVRYKNAADKHGDYLYKAGARLRKEAAKTNAAPFDPASVPIEDNIPAPNRRDGLKFAPLLERMTKVGQSAQVPLRHKHMLTKEISQLHKASPRRFTVRLDLEKQTLRVWRTD